jgi:hypothetical protein
VSSGLCATRYNLCTEPSSMARLELQQTRRACCQNASNNLIPGREFGRRNRI